jgi:hypothetical protein
MAPSGSIEPRASNVDRSLRRRLVSLTVVAVPPSSTGMPFTVSLTFGGWFFGGSAMTQLESFIGGAVANRYRLFI